MMKFEYIKMLNYRQYKDTIINFPIEESKKNFIVIIGTTGAGKKIRSTCGGPQSRIYWGAIQDSL